MLVLFGFNVRTDPIDARGGVRPPIGGCPRSISICQLGGY